MSIWTRLVDLLGTGANAVGGLIDRVVAAVAGDPEHRRDVAFSAAMIGLSAKMAKADGVVTRDEVSAFRRLFVVPPGEERAVTGLFDLARRDVAGFQTYARRIADLYGADDPILEDIIDGLFDIARADGLVHEAELAYLAEVARLFGFDDRDFARIQARHVQDDKGDPYLVLGIERGASWEAVRRRYRRLAAENHPDKLIAHGVPEEFVAIATERLAAINHAYETLEAMRAR